MNTWLSLVIETYPCGHPRTLENSISAGRYRRCRICHNANGRTYLARRKNTHDLNTTKKEA